MSLTSSLHLIANCARRQRLAAWYTLPAAILVPKHYVLVLSHMRAYTSLLCHILASHPQISGYAESMVDYARPFALTRLRYQVWVSHQYQLKGTWVLDKSLHNKFLPTATVLNRARVTPLFLLRPPEPTLNSIVKMLRWQQPDPSAVPHQVMFALTYYGQRLQKLSEYASQLERPGLYLDADAVIEEAPRTFAFLQHHLGLRQALQEQYHVFSLTGQPHYGDMSPYIRLGYMVRDKPPDAAVVPLSGDLLAAAHDAYRQCRTTLRQHCHTL
jgi:hypothetical protein